MLNRRDVVTWSIAFLVVSVWIAISRFESSDADSMLYAGLSARIAEQPWPHWIAPEWWGLWPRIGLTGYFREHPVGGFILPALLARAGVPGEQAAYIVGVGAGLVVLILIGHLVSGVATSREGRATLLLLQLMPVAFVFRVRANQEYLLLACLLLTMIGLDRSRQSWRGVIAVAAGIVGALLVKGAFLILVLGGAGLWMLLNPRQIAGPLSRPIVATAVGLIAAAAVTMAYEAVYRHVTGESFLATYWERQFSEVQVSTPVSGAMTFLQHAWFYVVRLLWHPAPWSLALGFALSGRRARAQKPLAQPDVRAARGVAFAIGYAALLVLILSPSSRVAERYVFYGAYAIAAAGAVAAYRHVDGLRSAIERFDARVPALPAVLWFSLVAARLGLGPWLPRI